jgi:hypothetical protein
MKNKNPTSFLLYLEKIMPGIRLKNKLWQFTRFRQAQAFLVLQ